MDRQMGFGCGSGSHEQQALGPNKVLQMDALMQEHIISKVTVFSWLPRAVPARIASF